MSIFRQSYWKVNKVFQVRIIRARSKFLLSSHSSVHVVAKSRVQAADLALDLPVCWDPRFLTGLERPVDEVSIVEVEFPGDPSIVAKQGVTGNVGNTPDSIDEISACNPVSSYSLQLGWLCQTDVDEKIHYIKLIDHMRYLL